MATTPNTSGIKTRNAIKQTTNSILLASVFPSKGSKLLSYNLDPDNPHKSAPQCFFTNPSPFYPDDQLGDDICKKILNYIQDPSCDFGLENKKILNPSEIHHDKNIISSSGDVTLGDLDMKRSHEIILHRDFAKMSTLWLRGMDQQVKANQAYRAAERTLFYGVNGRPDIDQFRKFNANYVFLTLKFAPCHAYKFGVMDPAMEMSHNGGMGQLRNLCKRISISSDPFSLEFRRFKFDASSQKIERSIEDNCCDSPNVLNVPLFTSMTPTCIRVMGDEDQLSNRGKVLSAFPPCSTDGRLGESTYDNQCGLPGPRNWSMPSFDFDPMYYHKTPKAFMYPFRARDDDGYKTVSGISKQHFNNYTSKNVSNLVPRSICDIHMVEDIGKNNEFTYPFRENDSSAHLAESSVEMEKLYVVRKKLGTLIKLSTINKAFHNFVFNSTFFSDIWDWCLKFIFSMNIKAPCRFKYSDNILFRSDDNSDNESYMKPNGEKPYHIYSQSHEVFKIDAQASRYKNIIVNENPVMLSDPKRVNVIYGEKRKNQNVMTNCEMLMSPFAFFTSGDLAFPKGANVDKNLMEQCQNTSNIDKEYLRSTCDKILLEIAELTHPEMFKNLLKAAAGDIPRNSFIEHYMDDIKVALGNVYLSNLPYSQICSIVKIVSKKTRELINLYYLCHPMELLPVQKNLVPYTIPFGSFLKSHYKERVSITDPISFLEGDYKTLCNVAQDLYGWNSNVPADRLAKSCQMFHDLERDYIDSKKQMEGEIGTVFEYHFNKLSMDTKRSIVMTFLNFPFFVNTIPPWTIEKFSLYNHFNMLNRFESESYPLKHGPDRIYYSIHKNDQREYQWSLKSGDGDIEMDDEDNILAPLKKVIPKKVTKSKKSMEYKNQISLLRVLPNWIARGMSDPKDNCNVNREVTIQLKTLSSSSSSSTDTVDAPGTCIWKDLGERALVPVSVKKLLDTDQIAFKSYIDIGSVKRIDLNCNQDITKLANCYVNTVNSINGKFYSYDQFCNSYFSGYYNFLTNVITFVDNNLKPLEVQCVAPTLTSSLSVQSAYGKLVPYNPLSVLISSLSNFSDSLNHAKENAIVAEMILAEFKRVRSDISSNKGSHVNLHTLAKIDENDEEEERIDEDAKLPKNGAKKRPLSETLQYAKIPSEPKNVQANKPQPQKSKPFQKKSSSSSTSAKAKPVSTKIDDSIEEFNDEEMVNDEEIDDDEKHLTRPHKKQKLVHHNKKDDSDGESYNDWMLSDDTVDNSPSSKKKNLQTTLNTTTKIGGTSKIQAQQPKKTIIMDPVITTRNDNGVAPKKAPFKSTITVFQ